MKLTEEQKQQLEHEFKFTASRSSGPGGQHVNKVNTRVELRLSISDSAVFSAHQKAVLLQKLGTRINASQELVLSAESERSQWRNKENVKKRFFSLTETALTPPKKRKKTKPSASSRLKRLQNKKQLSEKKARRKNPQQ